MMELCYTLESDLVAAVDLDDLATQVARMKATSRFVMPGGGRPFRVRFNFRTESREQLAPTYAAFESWLLPDQAIEVIECRFDPDGEFLSIYDVYKMNYPGRSDRARDDIAARYEGQPRGNSEHHVSPTPTPCWEGSWLCLSNLTNWPTKQPQMVDVALTLRDILIVMLHDRHVNAETIEHRAQGRKWLSLRMGQPDMRETILRCPKRVYAATGTGTHASPRVHWRCEHERSQHYGKGNALVKTIVVPSTWVNDSDLPPDDPSRSRRMKFYKLQA